MSSNNIISSVVCDANGIELNAFKKDKSVNLSLQTENSTLTAIADTVVLKPKKDTAGTMISISDNHIILSLKEKTYIKIEDGNIKISCNGNAIEFSGENINVSAQKNVEINAAGVNIV